MEAPGGRLSPSRRLGALGVPRAQRWRITALFVVFEAGMPLIGLDQAVAEAGQDVVVEAGIVKLEVGRVGMSIRQRAASAVRWSERFGRNRSTATVADYAG